MFAAGSVMALKERTLRYSTSTTPSFSVKTALVKGSINPPEIFSTERTMMAVRILKKSCMVAAQKARLRGFLSLKSTRLTTVLVRVVPMLDPTMKKKAPVTFRALAATAVTAVDVMS